MYEALDSIPNTIKTKVLAGSIKITEESVLTENYNTSI
jgi:hypothetical protein